jgi:diguanylate cyclase (GGDEF)-like protein
LIENIDKSKWKSFRITLLLYVVLVVLGVGAYYIYTSYTKIAADKKVMYTVGLLDGLHLGGGSEADVLKAKTLNVLQAWSDMSQKGEFYTGIHSFKDDLAQVKACVQSEHANECTALVNDFSTNVSNMVRLRERSFFNTLWAVFAIVSLIIIFIIYLVRTFIAYQIQKHAVFDFETNLFNKKYYKVMLVKMLANSKRHHEPVSSVTMTMTTLEKITDRAKRKRILKEVGDVILSQVRTSDIACRVDNELIVLLPYTDKAGAENLRMRLKDAVMNDTELQSSMFDYQVSELGVS